MKSSMEQAEILKRNMGQKNKSRSQMKMKREHRKMKREQEKSLKRSKGQTFERIREH